MAINKNDPPKKGKTTLGAGTGTGITKYAAENPKQKAIKEAAKKAAAAAARKPAPKKSAPKKAAATAPAPKKAAAPAPAPASAVAAKKPSTINKRAPLMDVDLGKKGYKMSIDTTSMNKPDESTYNYIIRNSSGKVTSKGNLASAGGGAGIGKSAARQIVNKYKGKK